MLSPVGSRSRGRIGQDLGDDGAGNRGAAGRHPQDRPGDGVDIVQELSTPTRSTCWVFDLESKPMTSISSV
jgi:hypothetical protein